MLKTPEPTKKSEAIHKRFDYVRFASSLAGPFIQPYLVYFLSLKTSMKKADINISLEDYMSVALLTSVGVFFFMTLPLAVLIVLITNSMFTSLMLSILGAILSSVLIFVFFCSYPKICMGDRKKKIDGLVPYATLYLTTISGGGTPPIAMFRTLSKFDDYGEISKEARKIVEEVDVLGIDMLSALKNAAERTPSNQFVDLLWGMRTVEMSGGDLRIYLRENSKAALERYKMTLKAFQQKLSMIVEMYLTVVMIGSIMFMVITAIMGSMGGTDLSGIIVGSQMVLVFIIIPMSSAGIIVFIKGITPEIR